MRLNEKKNLKLVCKNPEDLKVISAYLQDSIATSKDIKFLKKNRTFLMIVNRFMWEDVEKGVFRESKRIRCAIKFEHVLAVKSKQINQKNKTVVNRIYHLDRGYEKIEKKLSDCNAQIKRLK